MPNPCPPSAVRAADSGKEKPCPLYHPLSFPLSQRPYNNNTFSTPQSSFPFTLDLLFQITQSAPHQTRARIAFWRLTFSTLNQGQPICFVFSHTHIPPTTHDSFSHFLCFSYLSFRDGCQAQLTLFHFHSLRIHCSVIQFAHKHNPSNQKNMDLAKKRRIVEIQRIHQLLLAVVKSFFTIKEKKKKTFFSGIVVCTAIVE